FVPVEESSNGCCAAWNSQPIECIPNSALGLRGCLSTRLFIGPDPCFLQCHPAADASCRGGGAQFDCLGSRRGFDQSCAFGCCGDDRGAGRCKGSEYQPGLARRVGHRERYCREPRTALVQETV